MVVLILRNASPPSSVATSSEESPDSTWTRRAMAVMGGVGHPDNWANGFHPYKWHGFFEAPGDEN